MTSKITEFMDTSRPTLVNWPNTIKRIVDDYKARGADILHGNQKDAIQNIKDAINPDSSEKPKGRIGIKEYSGKKYL